MTLFTPASPAAAARRLNCALSRLRTATPSPVMPWKISALASAMSSTDSKWAPCTASTLVITATSGLTIRDRGAISPGWFMPISNTPKVESAAIRDRLNGTPQWLLRLPWLAAIGPCSSSTKRIASLVPVLPTLPVTAMIRAPVRRRAACPRSLRARVVSLTSSNGASPLTASGRRLTTAAAAPAAMASAAKSWPSKLGPRMATNRSPGLVVRLSMETPSARHSPWAMPPVAASAEPVVQRYVFSPGFIVRSPLGQRRRLRRRRRAGFPRR